MISLVLAGGSLGIGMIGYHAFAHRAWLDAYANAAMILSGMGPLASPQTPAGKLFAGSYALFHGVVFVSPWVLPWCQSCTVSCTNFTCPGNGKRGSLQRQKGQSTKYRENLDVYRIVFYLASC